MKFNGSISTISTRDKSEQVCTLYPDGSNGFERGVAYLHKNIIQLYSRLGHSKGPASPQHQRQDDVLSSLVFVVSQLSQLQPSSQALVEVNGSLVHFLSLCHSHSFSEQGELRRARDKEDAETSEDEFEQQLFDRANDQVLSPSSRSVASSQVRSRRSSTGGADNEEFEMLEVPQPPPPSQDEALQHWTRAIFTDSTA
jgi:hypothetical protein